MKISILVQLTTNKPGEDLRAATAEAAETFSDTSGLTLLEADYKNGVLLLEGEE